MPDAMLGACLVGFVIALGLIIICKMISWFAYTYVGIFNAGIGNCWEEWNIIQKVLFLLGLSLFPMAIAAVITIHILGWIALVYLGICTLRAIFR